MIYHQSQLTEGTVTNACKYSENSLLLGTDKANKTGRKAEDSLDPCLADPSQWVG